MKENPNLVFSKISEDRDDGFAHNRSGITHLTSMNNKEKIKENLKRTVNHLAGIIGSRGYVQTQALEQSAIYVKKEFEQQGYEVLSQDFRVNGKQYENVWVRKQGISQPEKVIVVGAHYDTVTGTPGADDNASGIAALLELARLLFDVRLDKTVHFVAFTLEEPPFFRTKHMGSYVYAKQLNESKTQVDGMICLESIGYFRDDAESQMFPLPFFRFLYPTTGNYIVFVSDFRSKRFMNRAKQAFKQGSDLAIESIASFSVLPGVDFSDHRSFWKFGYDAFMVTDTAFYRNPNYHEAGDYPDTLDYERMTEVVLGMKAVMKEIAGGREVMDETVRSSE